LYPLNRIVKGVKEYMEMISATIGAVLLPLGFFLIFNAQLNKDAHANHVVLFGGVIIAVFGYGFLMAGYIQAMLRMRKERKQEAEETKARKEEATIRQYSIASLGKILSKLEALKMPSEGKADKNDRSENNPV
jgi:predicted histidine transporter YuiF (NhaC family)